MAYYRNTWVEINLDAIESNIHSLQNILDKDTEIMAVVKANAYGHGDVQVAKVALEAGCTMLAVAFLDEALALREAKITAPILVLGATRPTDINLAATNGIILTVFQEQWLEEASKYIQHPILFHLKMDTGVNRLGVKNEEEARKIVSLISENPYFRLDGIFTHFATADELDTSYFEEQYTLFTNMLTWLPKVRCIHCGNSATSLRFPKKVYNAVRFGISMYGLSPSNEMKAEIPFELTEALTLHSRLVHVKELKNNEKISYGSTYTMRESGWIGTIPVGYADGWIRKMQNFHVLIDGEKMPIVGRICMDQFMVHLSKSYPVGTQVTLIGTQHKETITMDDVANYLGTINYEVACMISYRVPRIFLREKRIMEIRNRVLT